MSTIIIGGGLSGLACANRLRQRGGDVVVFEADAEPGGAVRSVRQDGYLLELGPNTVRPTRALWSLCGDLGIEDGAVFASARLPRFISFGGTLRRAPFGALSARGLLRAIAEPLIPRRRETSEESIGEFGRRRFGTEVAERLLAPFVSGIYAGDSERLSASAAFPVLSGAERKAGSVLLGMMLKKRNSKAARPPRGLLSFRDGLATLPRALGASLGERFRSGVRVARIVPQSAGWRVGTSEGNFEAARLVVAASASEAARLVESLSPEAARALSGIPAPPLTVAHLSLRIGDIRRPVAGFGCLVAPSQPSPFLGMIWTSQLFAGRAPEGRVLWTAFLGGRLHPESAALGSDEIARAAFLEWRDALDLATPPEVIRVTRYDRAIPQYERGHADRMAALAILERERAGLYFVGNYRGGIAVGDVVENAARDGYLD